MTEIVNIKLAIATGFFGHDLFSFIVFIYQLGGSNCNKNKSRYRTDRCSAASCSL